MARKPKEAQLQTEIETNEEFEIMLNKDGLNVVDVYQAWCGYCNGMTSIFRKFRNEINDDLLNFYAAKADTIGALEKYRGKCEPCFLFFAGGVLVAVVRGANSPLLLRTLTEQLQQEHKIRDGNIERRPINDMFVYEEQNDKCDDEDEKKDGQKGHAKGDKEEHASDKGSEDKPAKEVSVVIIKPDAVKSGKAKEIMTEMVKRGIEILRQEERHMKEEEVKNIYSHLQDQPFFNDLVKYMSSSPCLVLAITKGATGENIIKEFRELIGPNEVEHAKTQAPESFRAKFGASGYMNAVHGSDSQDTAARELAFFFPDFAAPKVEGPATLQRTLALLRPDVYKKHKDEILVKVLEAGFKIAMQKEVQLTKHQAEEFYNEHKGQAYFDELTTRMSSGPLLALGLAREDAITGWRTLLGPTTVEEAKSKQPDSLRAKFSCDGSKINMLHGSESVDKARKEIEFFFPMQQTLAVIKPDAYATKEEIIKKIHEAGFRIAARKETQLSKEMAEEFYADQKDKEYYKDLVTHMTSGKTYFMVLTREGAVDGWRSLIGPPDPAKAKTDAPDTIRAQLGSDVLRNAVHGPINLEQAHTDIHNIFGLNLRETKPTKPEAKDSKPSGTKDAKPSKSEGKDAKPTSAQKKGDDKKGGSKKGGKNKNQNRAENNKQFGEQFGGSVEIEIDKVNEFTAKNINQNKATTPDDEIYNEAEALLETEHSYSNKTLAQIEIVHPNDNNIDTDLQNEAPLLTEDINPIKASIETNHIHNKAMVDEAHIKHSDISEVSMDKTASKDKEEGNHAETRENINRISANKAAKIRCC